MWWRSRVLKRRVLPSVSIQHHYFAVKFNGVLPGDRSYACMPFLLTAYPDPQTEAVTAINNAYTKTTGPLKFRLKIHMTLHFSQGPFSLR